MYGTGFRPRTGEAIYSEAETAVKAAGARVLAFIDLDFCLNREGAAAFCEEALKRRLKTSWCCTAHVDSVDPDLLELMGKAGCRLIHYGLESASERVLGLLGRPPPGGRENLALEWTRKAGILSLGFFMFGAYDEKPKEREATLRLALSLPLDLASFHICNPLPGTGAERYLERDRSELFPRVFPGQDEEELDRFCRRAWKAFYFRPGRLARTAVFLSGAGLAPVRLVSSLLAPRRG